MTQLLGDKETMLFLVIGVIAALILVIQLIFKVWPFLSKLVTMVNGFVGYGAEPGVLDRLATLEENSDKEQGNHEKMSQQFDRVEAKLEILSQRLDESVADRKALWAIAQQHHQPQIEEKEDDE